jgi:hypothetical protein
MSYRWKLYLDNIYNSTKLALLQTNLQNKTERKIKTQLFGVGSNGTARDWLNTVLIPANQRGCEMG